MCLYLKTKVFIGLSLRNLLLILCSLFFGTELFSAPATITFQARIVKPDLTNLESSSVSFRFLYLYPKPSVGVDAQCVIYVEDITGVNMTGSKGLVTLQMGSGVKAYGNGNLKNVFDNSTASYACQAGGTYTPAANDNRRVIVQFNDGTGTQTLPASDLSAVPFAMQSYNSQRLGNSLATDFLKFTDFTGTCAAGEYLKYDSSASPKFSCATPAGSGTGIVNSIAPGTGPLLMGGTSADVTISIPKATASTDGYLSSADFTTFNSKLSNLSSLTSGDITGKLGYTPAANNDSRFTDTRTPTDGSVTAAKIASATITFDKFNQSGASTGQVIKWDGSAWVASSDNTGSSAVTSVAGRTGVVTLSSGDISGLTFGSAAGTFAQGNDSRFTDQRTPTNDSVTSAKILDGTITSADISNGAIEANKLAQMGASSGQVLKWNGSAWVASSDDTGAGGTVTNVSASGPLSSTGGGTPNISIAQANGTTDGYLSSADFTTFAAKLSDFSTLLSSDITGKLGYTPVNPATAVTTVAGRTGAVTLSSSDISGLAFGSAAGTFAQGNDSRFSDQRTPTNDSVTSAKILDGTITAADLSSMDASVGQVMKWNGSAWVASSDNSNGGTVTTVTASGPLSSSGGSAPNITLAKANGATDGYLSSADFTTFAAKLSDFSSLLSSDITGKLGYTPVNPSTLGTAALLNTNQVVLVSNMPANCNAGQALTFSSPTGAWVCSNIVLNSGSVTNAMITSLDWTKVVNTPTTAAGYGIAKATAGVDGYLSSADFTTFAAKLSDFSSLLSSDITGKLGYTPVNPATAVTSVAGRTGVVTLSSSDISGLAFGTAAGTYAQGNDARFTDQRTPTNDSVTSAKILDGTITSADISASAITFDKLNQSSATTGQVIKWNGSAWIASSDVSSGGTVTSVTSANADISVATTTTTPVLTLNSGTGNNQILKLNGTAQIPAVDGSLVTSLNASNLASGTVAAARMPAHTGEVTSSAGSVGLTITNNAVTAAKLESGSNGQLFIGNGTGFTKATLTGTTDQVNVTNGSGTITLSTPQSIATTSSPSFTGLTVSGITGNTLLRANGSGVLANATSADITGLLGTLPAYKGGTGQSSFTVGDLLYASSTTALSKLAASTSGYVLTSNGAGTAPSWQAASGSGISGLTTNYITKAASGSTITNSLIFDNGTNVGIGTAVPGGILDVTRANDQGVIFRLGTVGGFNFDFSRSSVGALTIQGSQVGSNGIVLAPTSGGVGIGYTTPGTSGLWTGATASTNQITMVDTTNTANTSFANKNGTLILTKSTAFGNPATSGTAQNAIARFQAQASQSLDFGSDSASPWGQWLQSTHPGNLAQNYPLNLNPNGGNVGIGLTNPGYALQVSGDISISGNFKVNGTNINSGTVSSVTSANADISVATTTTTPVLTLNSGTGNNQILKLNGTAQIPAVDGSLVTSLNASNLASGTVAAARMPAHTGEVTSSAGSVGLTITNNAVTAAKLESGSNGQLFIGNGTGFTKATLTGTANQVTVTNGSGTITLAAPQNIHSAATPTFAGLTLSGITGNTLLRANGSGLLANATSADVTGLLGYTPASGSNYVAKAGDTMTGTLNLPANGLVLGTNQLVANGGFVGIGTNSPSYALEVAGGAGGYAGLFRGTATTTRLGVENSAAAANGNAAELEFRLAGNDRGKIAVVATNSALESYDMTFHSKTSGFSLERMRIRNDGYVGIGTSSPYSMLDVAGSVKVGTDATTCSNNLKGALRLNSTILEFCNGTAWGAVGALSNYTETLNVSAPNATIPAVQLAATNAAADVDLVLKAKGDGSILAQTPDNTATGGNKRGLRSVDLQMLRSGSTMVASGSYSVISGGYNNTASGSGSVISGGIENLASVGTSIVVGGYRNSAQANYAAVVGGQLNNITSQFGFIGNGYRNDVFGNYASVLNGQNNIASGANSVVLNGSSNVASGDHSAAIGVSVTAPAYAQTTVGQYNLPTGSENLTTWIATDPLFVIGNGTGSGASRSNAVTVLKNGNMGLGTTSPVNSLDVVGSAGASRIVQRNSASTGFSILEAQNNDYWSLPSYIGTSVRQFGSAATGTTAGLANANLGVLYFQNGSAGLVYNNGGSLYFGTTTATAPQMSILHGTGNVGIGTANPTAKFQVLGSSIDNTAGDSITLPDAIITGANRAFNTALNPSNLAVMSNSNLGADVGATIGLGGRYTGTQFSQFGMIKGAKENATDGNYASYLAFGTRANGANITEKMRIDSSGNVSIGVGGPGNRLDISGAKVTNGSLSSQMYIRDSSAYNATPSAGIGFVLNYGASSSAVQGGISLTKENATDGDRATYLGFYNSLAGSPAERMRIDSAGNVGIATGSPRATLDVSGPIISRASQSFAAGTIDFSASNLRHTTQNCGAFALHNLKDGGTYMFAVQGTTVATCSFTAFSDAGSTALTVHMPPDHAATTTGKHTIYNIAVLGTHAYIAWTPGY